MAKEFAGDAPAAAAPYLPHTANFYPELSHNGAWTKSWVLNVSSNPLDGQRITFQIPKLQGGNYSFYQRARVKLRISLFGKKAEKPSDNMSLAPINNVANSMFNSVRLFLNETQVTGSTNGLYHFAAYVNSLVCHPRGRKDGILTLGGYYEEGIPRDPFPESRWRKIGEPYSGWTLRRNLLGTMAGNEDDTGDYMFKYYDRQKKFTVYADLMTDLKGCDVPMLPDVGGRLEMTLNPGHFVLQCEEHDVAESLEEKYFLHIDGAELEIPVQTLQPSLHASLERQLTTKPVEYHTTRLDMRKIPIPAGRISFITDAVKQTASSPDRIILFLANKSYLESPYGISPYCFNNYVTKDMWEVAVPNQPEQDPKDLRAYLTSVRMTLNNETLESSENIQEPQHLVMRKLAEFYENMGLDSTPYSVAMNAEEYANGKFVMVYDLTAAKMASVGGSVRQEARAGNLKCELQFDKETPNESYLFVMSEFHSKIIVDKNRNVVYRYLD